MKPSAQRWIGYPAAIVSVGATIGLLKLFPQLNESSVALLLLLAVFFCASVWQSGPGVVAALLATLGFNFFFLPPLYTLTVQDPRNVAALFVFLVSGLLIGRLSALSRQRLGLLEAERRDLIALTQLSQGFLADTNRESLFGVAADRLRQALQCREVAILIANEKGELLRRVETPGTVVREDLAELAFRQGNSAAYPSDLGGIDITLPIPIGLQRAGVLVARGLQSSERMAEACALLLGLAVERERFLGLARAAEETRTSDQMKSTLLAQLAHDLKTPVAAARGAIENWQADSGASEASRAAAAQLDALSRRIAELMDLVRLDSGAARPNPEKVSCAEIVEAAVARFGEALAGHSLYLEPPAPGLSVEVDPAQLTEALGHGLENAARYSPPGSAIRVSVSSEGANVFFRVADQGRGIPPGERDHVFERFVRLENNGDFEGIGLGLSIARSLVALNGGSLRISESESGGALFEITLPRAAA
ncbi:MAG TPA: ATP-binding protein [Thermoanaerobaculia bacterium]|nr:ATP-binding protein [Thermoanaerobaculia bacterium]